MQVKRKRRIYFISFLLVGISAAVGLALYALKQNINLYYTPQQVAQNNMSQNQEFRLGGMVVKGSVHHVANSLAVSFVLTDYHKKLLVEYSGILPALFREGQGIVAQGHLDQHGIFKADQVLAKHDANYHPPGIKG